MASAMCDTVFLWIISNQMGIEQHPSLYHGLWAAVAVDNKSTREHVGCCKAPVLSTECSMPLTSMDAI